MRGEEEIRLAADLLEWFMDSEDRPVSAGSVHGVRSALAALQWVLGEDDALNPVARTLPGIADLFERETG